MSSRHSRIQSPITDPTEHGEKIDFLNADGHFLAFAESISWKLIENLFKWVIWAEHSATSSASIPRERNTPPVTIYFSSKSHNPGVLRIDRRNCIVGYKLLLRGWIPRPVTTEPPLWAGLGNVVPDTNHPLLGNGPPASPLAPYCNILVSTLPDIWYFKQIPTQHTYIHTMMAGKSLQSEDQVNASDFCKVES